MEKAFNLSPWENRPSVRTAIGEIRLNSLNDAVNTIDDRVIELDITKANKTELSNLFSEISFDEQTGTITFTRCNGSTIILDTKLEKLAVNFKYDAANERLAITLDDGTEQYVDMSALVTIYEFIDSDTIIFHVQEDGKVSATIKSGSITGDMLNPDYLALIVQSVNTAKAHAQSADTSAALSKRWAVGDNANYPESSTDNAQYYAELAQAAAEQAKQTVNINLPDVYVDTETMMLMGRIGTEYKIYMDENGMLWGGIGNG